MKTRPCLLKAARVGVVTDLALTAGGGIFVKNNGQGTQTGFVYCLTNTLLLEGGYEFIHSSGPNALPPNFLVFQIPDGFQTTIQHI